AVYQELSYENNNERRALATRDRHLMFSVSPVRSVELYDLVADPGEEHDIWSSAPDAQALFERLGAMIEESQATPAVEGAVLPAARRPSRPVNGRFGDAVRFLGADLPERADGEVDVTWYFQSEKALAGNWKPFVHLEGPNGAFVNADHDPPVPIAR